MLLSLNLWNIPSLFGWIVLFRCSILISSQENFRDFILVVDTQKQQIVQVSLEDGSYTHQLQLDDLQNPVAIDYDPIKKLVFWTDARSYQILSASIDGSNQKVVLQLLPTSTPEGLALDHIAELVFYTSNADPFIGVVTYSGSFEKVIVKDLKSPRDIITDQVNRKLYWCDYVKEIVERSNYDGSAREVVYRNPDSWINGLNLDVNANKLYWTDAKNDQVGSLSLTDLSQSIVITASDVRAALHPSTNPNKTLDVHFFGISSSQQHLYVTDWSDRRILKVSKTSNTVSAYGPESFGMLSGISVYQYENYRQGSTSSCQTDNGGCSHLCLPLPGGSTPDHVCQCPDNQPLQEDHHTCKDLPSHTGPDLLWLESDELFISYIRGIPGKPQEFLMQQELASWVVRSPYWLWSAVDFSFDKSKLYLVDQFDRFIVQLSLNGSLNIEVIHRGTSNQVGGVSYDWRSNKVYWTDVLYNWIKVCDAQRENVTWCKTLIETGLDQPHAIAVHPIRGLLFWTDWGDVPKIEVSTLAGEERKVIVTTNLDKPRGLTVDYVGDRLFWCNLNTVYRSKLDGSGAALIGESFQDNSFIGLTYFQDYVMAVDERSGRSTPQLWFFNLRTNRPVKMALERKPTDIVMYHRDRQPTPVDDNNVEIILDCNRCQHLCVTSIHHARDTQCLCADGYILNNDAQTCSPDRSRLLPHYIYALQNSLCIVPYDMALAKVEDPGKTFCHFQSSKRYEFGSLAVNTHEGFFYFSEVASSVRSIRRAHVQDVSNNTVVVYGVGRVTGLAVDYMSSNIYWSEEGVTPGEGQIWVSRMDGMYQKRLLVGREKPSAVVLDLEHKKMYWVESSPSLIRRSNLDGSEIEDFIIAGVFEVTGMAYSYKMQRLFWADLAQSKISSILYTGDSGTRRDESVPHGPSSSFYDIDLYKDFILVTNKGSNASDPGMRLYNLQHGTQGGAGFTHHGTHAYDVVVFSKDNQPLFQASSSGCASSPCAQLCLDLPRGDYKCACIDGMRPDTADNTRCVSELISSENFLLVTDDYRHTVYSLADADIKMISALNVPQTDRPLAVAYDSTEKKLYWSDFDEGFIKRSNMDGSEVEVIMEYKSLGGRVDGLAFDSVSHILYFSDTEQHMIGILNPSGSHHKILLPDVESPRDMKLDTDNGYLYYTVRKNDNGGIMRAQLDGRQSKQLIQTNISWPSGLDIDYQEGRMYWVDTHTERLESADMSGNQRKLVYQQNDTADPFGLAVVRDYLYWTDWNARGLFRVNKRDGSNPTVLGADFFGGLNDIKYIGSSVSGGTSDNPCSSNNGGCSHFCLRVPGGRVCECPDHNGQSVDTTDGKNCPTVEACTSIFPNLQFSLACTYRLGDTCDFTCAMGFQYSNPSVTTVTCGPGLSWDKNLYSLCRSTRCERVRLSSSVEVVEGCQDLANVGDMCRVKCKHGYTLASGDTMRTCKPDLTWSGAEVKCREIPRCGKPYDPWSQTVTTDVCRGTMLYTGDQCTVMCASSYRPTGVGQGTVTCMNSGQWSGTKPNCVAKPTTTVSPDSTTATVPPGAVGGKASGHGSVVAVTVGVIAGVTVLVIIVLVVVGCMLRRNVSLLAKLRSSPTFRRQSSEDTRPVISSREVSPSYNAKMGRVELDDSVAFENPGYTTLAQESICDGHYTSYEVIHPPSLTALDKIQVTVDPDGTAFSNPMYGAERKNSVIIDPVVLQKQLTEESTPDASEA